MIDADVLAALQAKHDQLQRLIETYQRNIASLGSDLANMRAVLDFHAQTGTATDFLPHMSVRKLFKREEMFGYCREAFQEAGGVLDTRELARFVVARKGLDPDDAVIRKRIVFSIMQVMRTARRHRMVVQEGKRKGVCLWRFTNREARPTRPGRHNNNDGRLAVAPRPALGKSSRP